MFTTNASTTIARRSSLGAALLLVASMFVLAAPAEAQTAGSHFQLDGTSGDYISQGNDIAFDDLGESVFIPSVNFDNGINVMVEVRENGAFVTRWHANFAAPNEVPLAQGDAFSATRFPFQAPDTAGLSIFGGGRGCNALTGDFVVNELTVVAGEVELFDADFSQSCDGGAVMAGSVRFATEVTPPIDTSAPVASAGLDQTGRIKGTSSDFVVEASCADDNEGVTLESAEINGVAVQDGERVQLVTSNRERSPKYRKGKLKIQSASIELVISCVDAAGNTATATIMPVYQTD